MGALKLGVRVPKVIIGHIFNKTIQEEKQVLTIICLVLSGKVLVHGNAGISRRWVIKILTFHHVLKQIVRLEQQRLNCSCEYKTVSSIYSCSAALVIAYLMETFGMKYRWVLFFLTLDLFNLFFLWFFSLLCDNYGTMPLTYLKLYYLNQEGKWSEIIQ